MKRIIIVLFLTFVFTNLIAQQKQQVIYRDTINLRGYVFDDLGKPVKYLHIESTQLDIEYNQFKVQSYTDTNGYFELRGAKFNDTLKIREHAVYYTPTVYNKDSRYIVIYLPSKVIDINSSNPIEIKHKRITPKITPSFNIKPFESERYFSEIHMSSKFPGGVSSFKDFIERNVKYPEAAVSNNVEGTVEIGFKIERDGSLDDFKILRGIGYGCDQEVINVLRGSSKWSPAIEGGRPYALKQTVSVKFSLTDN